MTQYNVTFFRSFLRSQVTSMISTGADIAALIILTEYAKIYYVGSAAIASVIGGIVGFLLGRYWAFKRNDKPIIKQAMKYTFSTFLLLILNVSGIYFLTDFVGIQYIISKVIIATLLGIFVSFGLYRYFVYK